MPASSTLVPVQRTGEDIAVKRGYYPRHRDIEVDASPSFPQMRGGTLAFWATNDTFQKLVDNHLVGEGGHNEFILYDGPPFVNGLLHHGYLLTGYMKNTVGRYQTMLGHHAERRFGWDTHGLPAELEAQHTLGIEDITKITREDGLGIGVFSEACHSSVPHHTDKWEDYVTRQAHWVDFKNSYRALDPEHMESVIWTSKTLHDRELAYEGYCVLLYCWYGRTPLSSHELKMNDDVYQGRQDSIITVGTHLTEPILKGAEDSEPIFIRTTMSWTPPSNLVVAVGPIIDYAVVHVVDDLEPSLASQYVILAEARLGAYVKKLGENPRVVARLKGSDLAGRGYHPVFDCCNTAKHRSEGTAPGPNGQSIVPGDYVSMEDGTGFVHVAPAFDGDDMLMCIEVGIKPVISVDGDGCFTSEVTNYEGIQVFETNKPIIVNLRGGSGPMARAPEERCAILVQQESYVRSHPHCWYCHEPLIYKAVSSRFVKVTTIHDRVVEPNQEITRVPERTKDGIFGNWLTGTCDQSISRGRS